MKRIYIICFLLFSLFQSQGQVPDRGMLFKKLSIANSDSAKAEILNTIARTYVRKKPDSAIIYFNKALDYSHEPANFLFKVNTLSFMSMTYSIWGKQDSARINLEKAAEICKAQGLDSALHQVYFGLGNVLESQGDYSNALNYFQKASDYFEEKGYLKSLNRARAGMVYIYLEIEEFDKARLLTEKSNAYYKKIGADRQLMNGYSRLGIIFDNTSMPDSAIFYFEKAKSMAQTLKDDFVLAQVLLNLGNSQLKQKDYQYARKNYYSAVSLMKKNEAQPGDLLNAYTYLIYCNEILGVSYDQEDFITTKTSLFDKVEDPNDLKGYFATAAKIDSVRGDFKSSLSHYKKYQSLKDSLFNDKISEQLIEIETKYKTEKALSEKELAEERAALAESESQRNLILFIAALIVAALIIIILIFYYSRLRQRRKAELIALELKESQKRLSLEKQYRDSELKALKAQMNPHFIFNVLNSIQEFIVLNQKDLASDYLATFAELIRSYLHYSNQGYITINEEVEALNKYLQLETLRFEEKLQYDIKLDKSVLNDQKIPTMIIQPYVENAIKHGLFNKEEDQQLHIEFNKHSEEVIEVVIEDNGIGRDRAKEIQQNRIRLHEPFAMEATQSRLELLNQKSKTTKIGLETLDLKSEKGEPIGTRVELLIPILK